MASFKALLCAAIAITVPLRCWCQEWTRKQRCGQNIVKLRQRGWGSVDLVLSANQDILGVPRYVLTLMIDSYVGTAL